MIHTTPTGRRTTMVNHLLDNPIEWAIGTAVVLLVAVAIIKSGDQKEKFEQVCAQAGGTTVHDGRQNQCITPKEAAR
jgi:hypothetical protein